MSSSDQHFAAGDIPGLADDYRTAEISPTLKQNSDERTRVIVPDKCAEDGELELRQMTSDGDIEEAYVFLPSRCLWIELGFDETATSVRPDAELVALLVSHHEPIIVYHTHLRAQTESFVEFPAYKDLIASILLGGDLPLIEGRPIVHRAITGRGTFEYSLTLTHDIIELIATLKQSGLEGFIAQNLAYVFAGSRYEDAYYESIAVCARDEMSEEAPSPNCFPMSLQPFTMNYQRADVTDVQASRY